MKSEEKYFKDFDFVLPDCSNVRTLQYFFTVQEHP